MVWDALSLGHHDLRPERGETGRAQGIARAKAQRRGLRQDMTLGGGSTLGEEPGGTSALRLLQLPGPGAWGDQPAPYPGALVGRLTHG